MQYEKYVIIYESSLKATKRAWSTKRRGLSYGIPSLIYNDHVFFILHFLIKRDLVLFAVKEFYCTSMADFSDKTVT